jgi:peptide/nickel transport system substrate-binding protein
VNSQSNIQTDVNKDNSSFREFFWNYPAGLFKWYSKSKLLFYILFSFSLAGLLFIGATNTAWIQNLDIGVGNVYREGTVGVITTLNPLYLTQNPVDRDLHELIYDRLIYPTADGKFENGLATKWTVSSDHKAYTFTLDNNRFWHDGEKITSEDVKYTIEKAKSLSKNGDDTIGSVLENVNVKIIDDYHFEINIDEKNAVILEALSIYVMPKHTLTNVSDRNLYEYGLNVPPVGSSAYMVTDVSPTVVEFTAFDKYPIQAKITDLSYTVFPDLASLIVSFRNNQVDAVSHIDGRNLGFLSDYSNFELNAVLLKQRKKLIFFNTRLEKFEDYEIRGAITSLIDKTGVLEDAFADGTSVGGSISTLSWAYSDDSVTYPYSLETAELLFDLAGYEINDDGMYANKKGENLILTLTYLENSKNEAVVMALRDQMKTNGIELKLRPRSYASITSEVLATHDFELLLYEVETSIDPDQYNLWHSSKVDYPDLNLSGYENGRVDLMLEEARVAITKDERKEKYELFQRFMSFDAPVIFLYEPTFNLMLSNDIKDVELSSIAFPHDRFRFVNTWVR